MAKYKYRMKKVINGKPVGNHRIRGTGRNVSVIKPGDTITVDHPSELGGALFKFELLNGEQVEAAEQVASQPTAKLELVFVGNDENPDQYDVVNSETGQELNVNPLCKQDACSLAGIEYVADTPVDVPETDVVAEDVASPPDSEETAEATPPAPKKRTRRKATNK